jgi:hypothetical protein
MPYRARRRSSEPQVVTAQLIDGPATHQLHVAFDFGSEISKRPFNAGLTRGSDSTLCGCSPAALMAPPH